MLAISVNQPAITKQLCRAHQQWWALSYLPIRLYEPKGGDSYGYAQGVFNCALGPDSEA